MSARSVFPPRAVFQSEPLRRTARRIVRRWASSVRARRARACWCGETRRGKCARELAWKGVPQKRRRKKCRPKKDKGQRSKTRKKAACVPQGGGVLWRQRRCACAVILATPGVASPPVQGQGARGAPLLCGGGSCWRVRVRCVVLAMVMCGNVAAGTRARASRSGRVYGGVWQYAVRAQVASGGAELRERRLTSRSHVSLRARVATVADSERAQSSSQRNAQVLPWLTPGRSR